MRKGHRTIQTTVRSQVRYLIIAFKFIFTKGIKSDEIPSQVRKNKESSKSGKPYDVLIN